MQYSVNGTVPVCYVFSLTLYNTNKSNYQSEEGVLAEREKKTQDKHFLETYSSVI